VGKGLPNKGQFSRHGLLLVGHGTRNARGLAEFQSVARQVAELAAEFLVEACYLELAEPAISAAVRRLQERGVQRLTVAPLLLFAAGHAKRDIPEAVREAVGGELNVDYLGALECHERIVELSAQRYAEALVERPPVDSADTLLLLVGRGSSDAEAIGVMRRFAALRAERTGVGQVEVGFVAVAKPTLEEALDRAANTNFRRIVVQPHLLFAGEVLEEIRSRWSVVSSRKAGGGVQGAGIGNREPGDWGREPGIGTKEKEWILTEHSGASPLVAQAVVELVRRTARD
jgi:sirohydrochlorin cobaltochelatase